MERKFQKMFYKIGVVFA